MKRIPEEELMEEETSVQAYANADFSEPHTFFTDLFRNTFPGATSANNILDLGCGPGDIAIRFAKLFPKSVVLGLDGSQPMIDLAKKAVRRENAIHPGAVQFLTGMLPEIPVPQKKYDLIVSNSLLHHMRDPSVLWESITEYASQGTKVFIMDLKRPYKEDDVDNLVQQYTNNEPEILQNDFRNSLFAAYTVEEVREQLNGNKLGIFTVSAVTDRHLAVSGVFEKK